MQKFQRSIMTIYLTVIFIYMLKLTLIGQKEVQQLHLEQLYIEQFQQQLIRNGKISYQEYLAEYMELSSLLGLEKLQLAEYIKEYDSAGKIYYSLVTWEEIKEVLLREEEYCFEKESILEISVENRKGSRVLRRERIGEKGR